MTDATKRWLNDAQQEWLDAMREASGNDKLAARIITDLCSRLDKQQEVIERMRKSGRRCADVVEHPDRYSAEERDTRCQEWDCDDVFTDKAAAAARAGEGRG